jgi:hypothetical protein
MQPDQLQNLVREVVDELKTGVSLLFVYYIRIYHSSPKAMKNPQRRSLRPSFKNSSMANPSRNSAKNATNVSQSVIGSSFGRHLQTHPSPKSGRRTCKPSVTFPPQPKTPRTLFGHPSQVRRTCSLPESQTLQTEQSF